MLGAAISWGYSKKYVDYGLIVGGYGQNHHFYHVRGIDAPALKVGSLGFLPVLGGELIVHYPLSKNMTIGFANIVTPALTNHSILLRWAPNALVPQ